MIWPLLRRGLLVGVCAGLLAGCFAFVFGEPLVQDAIDIEQAAGAHASVTPVLAHVSDWAVSRPEQRGGLFLATALYGACVGTLFAVVFAVVRGRGAARDDWQLSIRLAAGLFAALVLVPFLKYPANPPAVGDPETIVERTWLYLAMLAGGLVSLVAAARVMWSVDDDAPPWRRPVLGAGTFVALTGFLALILPGVDEVPSDFPASLLWEFRSARSGRRPCSGPTIGVGYGIATLRAARRFGRAARDGRGAARLSRRAPPGAPAPRQHGRGAPRRVPGRRAARRAPAAAAARALAGRLGAGEALCSPRSARPHDGARRRPATRAPVAALDECDFGSWRGARSPRSGTTDPGAAPRRG